jgi:hypothetical protein
MNRFNTRFNHIIIMRRYSEISIGALWCFSHVLTLDLIMVVKLDLIMKEMLDLESRIIFKFD